MRNIWRVVFHALPIIPLVLGKHYFFLASLFLVGLAYIKVKKFDQKLDEADPSAKKQWSAIRKKWAYLTFID